MEQLDGRTAVVTGAGSGLGRELAMSCAAEGMRLVLADIDEESTAVTAALLPESAPVCRVKTDVSEADSVEALAARAYAEFGEVGVLFNNAGVAVGGWSWESTLEDWKWVLGVNLMGCFYILPHRGVKTDVENRMRGIADGARPVRGSLPSG